VPETDQGSLPRGDTFFTPTVYHRSTRPHGRTNREEIFGPVCYNHAIRQTKRKVIGYANDTEYGLASSVWTQKPEPRPIASRERIHTGTRLGELLARAPTLRVPFGGMKQSGCRPGRAVRKRFDSSPSPKNICIAKVILLGRCLDLGEHGRHVRKNPLDVCEGAAPDSVLVIEW